MLNTIIMELHGWDIIITQDEERTILMQYYKNGYCYYTYELDEQFDYHKEFSTD